MPQPSQLKTPTAARRLTHQSSRLSCIDASTRFLAALQGSFETARDQFEAEVLNIPEWRQAADALDHAYHACVARAKGDDVEALCREAQRRVEMAVQMSMVSSYYDGRLDQSYN
jgi:hypothetical protein